MPRRYYSIWSDNENKFGPPHPLPKGLEIHFPDIVFSARNIKEAQNLINQVNRRIKGKVREEFLRKGVFKPLGWTL